MKLAKSSRALTLLLALLTAVGPLSTDMYLPSLPAIGLALDAGVSMVQATLSVFMIGFAVGQLIYGPLSDRFGRRRVLVAGLLVYVAGSLVCMIAPSIEILIAARGLQAMGASAAIVLARAIVRDLHGGEKAARLLSLMGALMGVVPLIAPVLGAVLEVNFGWRSSFILISVLSALLLIAVVLLLEESLPESNRRKGAFLSMAGGFGVVLTNMVYRRYLTAISLAFGGLFAIISTSSFVFQSHFKLGELAYGFSFSLCVAGYIIGTLVSARLSKTHQIETMVARGSIWLGVSGAAIIMLNLIDDSQVWFALGPMFTSMIGIGILMPQSMAGALTPFPQMAGTASSLMGFLQNVVAAIVGAGTAWLIGYTPNGLVWVMGGLGMANLALTLLVGRKITQKRASADQVGL